MEARRAGVLRLTAKRTFDSLGRLTGTETRNAANQVLIRHGYSQFDSLDRRTVVDREDGKRWDYGYDPRGQVISAKKTFPTAEGGASLAGWASSYLYDSIGNLIASSDFAATLPASGSPLRSDYQADSLNQYDQRTVPGRLALSGEAAANAAVAVTVDDVAVPVTRQGAAGAQKFWEAEWTPANSAAAAFGTVRVKATVAGYASSGTVGTLFLPKTPEVFTHDRDGNLIQDGRWNYLWDAENRLIAMETRPDLMQPAGVFPVEKRTKLQFAYDYAGRRVRKQVFAWVNATASWAPQSDTRFLYDGWNLVAEFSASTSASTSSFNLLRSYVWGLDLSGSSQGAGGVGGLLQVSVLLPSPFTLLPSYDGNGNILCLVDSATGTRLAEYEYGPFGEPLKATGSAATANPFRFSTKYTDSETGLLYYGLRYYNPSTGRWPSRDPIEEAGGVNLYGFLNNAPVSGVDYLGLKLSVDTDYDPAFARDIRWSWGDDWGNRRRLGWTESSAKVTCGVGIWDRMTDAVFGTGCDLGCKVTVKQRIFRNQAGMEGIPWPEIYGHEQKHVLSLLFEVGKIVKELEKEPESFLTKAAADAAAKDYTARYQRLLDEVLAKERGHSNPLSPADGRGITPLNPPPNMPSIP
jgi:RHS repeat-associated protein